MRKYLAEFTGTFFLLTAVVGSGYMATNLTSNIALQLLINALATIAMLAVIISVFADVSGSHFNPVVTLYLLIKKKIKPANALGYILSQILGAILGTITANFMFSSNFIEISTEDRFNSGTFIGEVLATFGLLLVIIAKPSKVNYLVPAWIATAYFFTASTSFANPAVTLGRIFTDSFAGIAPASVLGFIGAQLIALVLVAWYSISMKLDKS
ncbi:MAG: aquaporin [Candidatus Nanopelagicaceae bacterium]|jgi:glycerol uptake facilitator-like aquaporin